MIDEYTAAAKAEAERIVHSQSYSEEEKTKRLQKLDAFLIGTIETVMSDEDDVKNSLNDFGEMSAEARADVESRLGSMHTMMDNMDAGDGIKSEERGATSSHAALSTLISDAEARVQSIKDKFDATMTSQETSRSLEANQVAATFEAAVDQVVDELELKESERKDERDEAQAKVIKRIEKTGDLADEAHDFMDYSDSKGLAIAERLGQTEHTRFNTMDKVETFTGQYASFSAEVMFQTVKLLKDLTTAARRHMQKYSGNVASWAKRMSTLENSDEYKMLRAIGEADKVVDLVSGRDADILHWTGVWSSETAKWRKAVVTAIEDLKSNMDEELEDIEHSGVEYEKALKATLTEEQDTANQEALKMMEGQDKEP